MKSILNIFIFATLCFSLTAQKVTIKDDSGNPLIEIKDEGIGGSILFPLISTPDTTKHKLYNTSGRLFWDGVQLGTITNAGGWRISGLNLSPSNLSSEVGIGTSNPTRMLEVHKNTGSINNINPIAWFRTIGTGHSAGSVGLQNTDNNYFTLGITQDPANHFAIGYNRNISLTSDLIRLTSDGLLGIGTTSPTQMLDIAGGIRIGDSATGNAGAIRFNSASNEFEGHDGSAWKLFGGSKWLENSSNIYYNSGNVGVGTSTPDYNVQVEGSTTGKVTLSLNNLNSLGDQSILFGSDPINDASITLIGASNPFVPNLFSFRNHRVDGSFNWVIESDEKMSLDSSGLLNLTGKLKIGDDSTTPTAGVLRYNVADSTFEGHDGDNWKSLSSSGGLGLWSQNGDKIYYSGRVGIWDSDPSYALTVGGEIGIEAFAPTIYFRDDPIAYGYLSCANFGMTFNNLMPTSTKFNTDGTARMTITGTGRVGIGTEDPGNMLHVIGDAHIEDASPRLGLYQGSTYAGYLAEIQSNLHLSNQLAGNLYLNTKGTKRITIDSNGYTGIGTITPAEKLHVKGNLRVDDPDPIIRLYKGTTYASLLHHSGDELRLTNNGVSGSIHLKINGGDKIVAKAGGEVGIGVSDPQHRLHVQGNEQYGAHITNTYTGSSTKYGLYSEANNSASGDKYGVYGKATANASQTPSDEIYGVKGTATADAGSTAKLFGVAGVVDADGGSGSSALYGLSVGTDHYALFADGNAHFAAQVRIGHTNHVTGYQLSVNGKAIAEELKVELSGTWPDYVLKKDYALLPLDQLEQEIKNTGHLPGVPSADDVDRENGFHVGEMNRVLLEKVEELTLYIIQQQKEIESLKREMVKNREPYKNQ